MPGPSGARCMSLLADFMRNERGATAIEYALVASGIALVIVSTVYAVRDNLMTNFYDRLSVAFTQ
jgi:pilus assembly protein Flp/PilA